MVLREGGSTWQQAQYARNAPDAPTPSAEERSLPATDVACRSGMLSPSEVPVEPDDNRYDYANLVLRILGCGMSFPRRILWRHFLAGIVCSIYLVGRDIAQHGFPKMLVIDVVAIYGIYRLVKHFRGKRSADVQPAKVRKRPSLGC